jgi:hypothetical protein
MSSAPLTRASPRTCRTWRAKPAGNTCSRTARRRRTPRPRVATLPARTRPGAPRRRRPRIPLRRWRRRSASRSWGGGGGREAVAELQTDAGRAAVEHLAPSVGDDRARLEEGPGRSRARLHRVRGVEPVRRRVRVTGGRVADVPGVCGRVAGDRASPACLRARRGSKSGREENRKTGQTDGSMHKSAPGALKGCKGSS